MSLVLALISASFAGCRNQRNTDSTIPRSQWPFHALELREAYSEPFPGSSPDHDEYGSFFVAARPFLGTEEIDRLECVKGSVFVVLRDRAALDFESTTAQLFTKAGRVAVYLDGKLNAAPVVRGKLAGGRFQLSQVACNSRVAGPAAG